jgi:hypothetical protein
MSVDGKGKRRHENQSEKGKTKKPAARLLFFAMNFLIL